MFKLLRRISYGVIPRPDRPWEDDATSNAPAPRKKRRLSSAEREHRDEDEDELVRKKRLRQDSESADAEGSNSRETPLPQAEAETKEVKEVTEGVKEVDLDADSKAEVVPVEAAAAGESVAEEPTVAPESVPLPDEVSGELDEKLVQASSISDLEADVVESEGLEVPAPAEETEKTTAEEENKDVAGDSETAPVAQTVDPAALALPEFPKKAAPSTE